MHDKQALHRRLKKIIGQLNGIDKMISEDAPCPDVLYSLMPQKVRFTKWGRLCLKGILIIVCEIALQILKVILTQR